MANCIETYTPHLVKDFDILVAGGMSEKEAGIKVAIQEYQLLFNELNKFKTSLGIKLSKEQKTYIQPIVSKTVEKFDIDEIITNLSSIPKDEVSTPRISNPSLQIAGITKGHPVKMYEDKKGLIPIWNRPLRSIPKLRLEESEVPTRADLKGGRFDMAIDGTIKVDGEEMKVQKGDVVLIDDEGNLHPMRARNINQEEINTVLYLLSLRAGTNQPTETIKITPPSPIRFGVNDVKNVPVFFNNEKDNKGDSHKNLMDTLISFGSKENHGKGEIYFNQETVANGNPVLVWTDFNGVTQNIEVSKIKNAVDNNDFSELQDLVKFLSEKRFNVNEHLLGTSSKVGNPRFNKPKLVYKIDESGKKVPELEWDNSKSYYHHLLNDILTTTTTQLKGYPKRLQRNVWFAKEPIQEEFSDLDWKEEVVPVEEKPKGRRKAVGDIEDFMDKVLTTSDLLKLKIQNGEIIQNCK